MNRIWGNSHWWIALTSSTNEMKTLEKKEEYSLGSKERINSNHFAELVRILDNRNTIIYTSI